MNARCKAEVHESLDAPVPFTPAPSLRENGRPLFSVGTLVWLVAVLLPRPALACSACFGASDSELAKGMNMGIFALLAVVVLVLGGIASFFIYLARRASAHTPQDLAEVTKQPS